MAQFKLLPIGAIIIGLSVSAAAIATAQNTPEGGDQPQASAKVHKAHGRKGQRGGRGGGGGEMMRMIFGEVDANGDGSVTQEEVDSYRATKLSEVDASGDGALSLEEFEALYADFTRNRMVDRFQDLDADGDGVISGAEMDERFGNIVERMDRDDDGALTLQDRRGRRG